MLGVGDELGGKPGRVSGCGAQEGNGRREEVEERFEVLQIGLDDIVELDQRPEHIG